MICSRCKKNEATIQIQARVDSHVINQTLCDNCLRTAAIPGLDSLKILSEFIYQTDSISFGLKPVAELLNILSKASQFQGARVLASECPACHFTLREFQKEGRMGCPSCYQHFRKDLRGLLKKIQGAHVHKGKKGKPHPITPTKPKRLIKPDPKDILQAQLEKAVKEEKYELAAKIRDQIKEISNQVQRPS